MWVLCLMGVQCWVFCNVGIVLTYTSIAPQVNTIPTLQNTQHCTPSQHNTHITEHATLHPQSAQYPHYRTPNTAPPASTIPTLQTMQHCTPSQHNTHITEHSTLHPSQHNTDITEHPTLHPSQHNTHIAEHPAMYPRSA